MHSGTSQDGHPRDDTANRFAVVHESLGHWVVHRCEKVLLLRICKARHLSSRNLPVKNYLLTIEKWGT